ncbi:MAG TPA: hypothetical protein PKY25_03000 [Bacilli bacterium]|nr:hypothetical protein [Bacilli bacterium]
MIKKILNVVFWVVFAIFMLTWSIDFIMALQDKGPVFCIQNKEYKYKDGKVTRCIGLGYKVYHYQRQSMGKGVEVTPLWGKMRTVQ